MVVVVKIEATVEIKVMMDMVDMVVVEVIVAMEAMEAMVVAEVMGDMEATVVMEDMDIVDVGATVAMEVMVVMEDMEAMVAVVVVGVMGAMEEMVVMEDIIESPGNGRVSTTGHTFGSLAVYRCYRGFILEPAEFSTRRCLQGGVWSGLPPRCRSPVTCSSLSAPANGNVDISRRTPGGVATYSCNEGFTLQPSASRTRTCQRNGRWSGVGPICRANRANCGDPGTPVNGRRVLGTTLEGDTVRYFCRQGFELVGNRERVCQSNGQWSGQLPLCSRLIDCGGLLNPLNGRVLLTGTDAGSRATYSCNEGFVLQGPQRRVCQANGQWSGRDPTCIPRRNSCGQLPNPRNGRVTLTGTTAGSLAVYTCRRGFRLVGNVQRSCQNNGQWSGSEPICRRNIVFPPTVSPPLPPGTSCPNPLSPANGQVQLVITNNRITATYSCNPGFRLVRGSRVRVCQNDNTFSGRAPICVEIGGPIPPFPPGPPGINCPTPASPANGQVVVTQRNNRLVATYSCNAGFRLARRARVRFCQNDDTFSGRAPICVEDGRPGPPFRPPGFRPPGFRPPGFRPPGFRPPGFRPPGFRPPGGRSRSRSFSRSNSRSFSITTGSRSSSITTRPPIRPPFPPPTGGTCPHLTPPKGGLVRVIGFEVGDTATYSCSRGFTLVGPPVRRCTRSGNWSRSQPNCVPDDLVQHLEKNY
ncbi:PREDICTED: CUB and sushi domain-containing protein 3-like [Amphimedon queenslandica]|uniref:Sushi domain-containing protein n=1 Tax=Amphimedon queenslandica TaxID=400682 RepID=A0AAN0J011_AMPQE|nr:PREDICTED: CUB and sushi domain-containing protein 3-like [Amphimedon queenslandica]|eukprot:XP_019850127.1 PREDICTED: CUB and sushi domain-containing protein 3-like [Amphimedon queenslandica]